MRGECAYGPPAWKKRKSIPGTTHHIRHHTRLLYFKTKQGATGKLKKMLWGGGGGENELTLLGFPGEKCITHRTMILLYVLIRACPFG